MGNLIGQNGALQLVQTGCSRDINWVAGRVKFIHQIYLDWPIVRNGQQAMNLMISRCVGAKEYSATYNFNVTAFKFKMWNTQIANVEKNSDISVKATNVHMYMHVRVPRMQSAKNENNDVSVDVIHRSDAVCLRALWSCLSEAVRQRNSNVHTNTSTSNDNSNKIQVNPVNGIHLN